MMSVYQQWLAEIMACISIYIHSFPLCIIIRAYPYYMQQKMNLASHSVGMFSVTLWDHLAPLLVVTIGLYNE